MAQARRAPPQKAAPPAGLAPGQVARAWAAGKLPRVVLVAGAETALREEALAGIRTAAFGPGDGGMNWVVLYGPSGPEEPSPLTVADILDEAFTRPMFGAPGELKVTVVRRADLLLAPARQKKDGDAAGENGDKVPAARDLLEKNLGKVPDGAVLVFEVAQTGNLTKTRFWGAIAALGGVVKCEQLRARFGLDTPDSVLGVEVERRGRTLGLALDPGAVGALLERSGQNLGLLEEELAKLSLALGATDERRVAVGAAEVAEVCARTRLVGPFEYTDAVAERDLKKSLEALGAIFAHGLADRDRPGRVVTAEAGICFRLLGPLTWKLNQLQDLHAALAKGIPEYEAFRAAKVFNHDAMRRTLRRHTAASLRHVMEALLRANLDLRSVRDRQEILQRLTWDICRGQ